MYYDNPTYTIIWKILQKCGNLLGSIFGLKTGKIENIYENPEKIKIKHDQSIGAFLFF